MTAEIKSTTPKSNDQQQKQTPETPQRNFDQTDQSELQPTAELLVEGQENDSQRIREDAEDSEGKSELNKTQDLLENDVDTMVGADLNDR